MHRQIYTIGFASYATKRDGSCEVTELNTLPTLDTNDYLRLSGALGCLDHHRSEVIQVVDNDQIYFLLPLPKPSDIERLDAIARQIEEDDPIKSGITAFCEAFRTTEQKRYAFVRIQYPKAA